MLRHRQLRSGFKPGRAKGIVRRFFTSPVRPLATRLTPLMSVQLDGRAFQGSRRESPADTPRRGFCSPGTCGERTCPPERSRLPSSSRCRARPLLTARSPRPAPRIVRYSRHLLSAVVIGAGRLEFYSAPNPNCAMAGVLVAIPKDELITYAQSSDGWSSVMYSNPKSGSDVSGWVRSSRLKQTGTVGH